MEITTQRLCPCCGQEIDAPAQTVEITDVLIAVCAVYSISLTELFSDTRQQPYARARQTAMLILCGYGYSQSRIARFLRVHHTTVLHGIRAMKDLVEVYPNEKARLIQVFERLQAT